MAIREAGRSREITNEKKEAEESGRSCLTDRNNRKRFPDERKEMQKPRKIKNKTFQITEMKVLQHVVGKFAQASSSERGRQQPQQFLKKLEDTRKNEAPHGKSPSRAQVSSF